MLDSCTIVRMDKYTIACLQANTSNDLAANLATVGAMMREAAANGAKLVATPEYTLMMDGSGRVMRDNALPPDGGDPLVHLRGLAKALQVWLLLGSLTLRTGEEGEGADTRIVNRSFLISDAGEVVASYDKIHLFDVDLPGRAERYRESDHISPGGKVALVDTPIGRVGLSVCYDMRFPELYREMVSAGAEVFTIPSAFTAPTGRAHWEVLLRARAIENLCFVLAPAQSGVHANGRETYGDSLSIEPWGRVLSRRPRGEGVVLAALDREAQQATRVSFPCLQNRVLSRSSSC